MRFLTLRYFNEVARLGSIRKAADRLHVAPSAVSRQISQLEHELDATLFERSRTGLQLTTAGEQLARHTHRIFRDLERARTAIDDLRGLRRGEISLSVIEGVVSGLLPGVIARFHERYPGVSFKVVTASTDRTIEALISDEADIGIVFNAPPRAEIQAVGGSVEPVYCLVSSSHPFAGRDELTLAEICREPLALSDPSFVLRQLFEQAAGRQRLKFTAAVTTNSLEMTKNMAATGRMVTFMPALTVVRELKSGSLKAIPVTDPEFALARSTICVHRDRTLPHAARAFLKLLIAEVEGLPSVSTPHEPATPGMTSSEA